MRVFEVRTYTVTPGKLPALLERFKAHSLPLFKKHHLDGVAYWTAREGGTDYLIYVVAHADRAAAERNWTAFRADPAWIEAKAASEAANDGPLVQHIASVIGEPTEFSPMR